jgi:hypothetical protein
MDMRDIKDRLEALEKQGVVHHDTDGWHTRTEEIRMTVRRSDDRLEISHATRTSSGATDKSTKGIVSRLTRLFNPFR